MIETQRFVASGSELRTLEKRTTIAAPREEVFAAWTTSQGVEDFLGVEANIELRVGGPFELFFMDADSTPPGQRGSEGCQILSYIPNQLVSFSWNAPPHLGEVREKRTWVVVRMRDAGPNQTKVSLTHTGFGDGESWDEVYAYFERAWSGVLRALEESFGRVEPTPSLETVILAVSDLSRSVAFYEKAFGWPRRIDVPVLVEFALPNGSGVAVYQKENFAKNVRQDPVLPPAEAIGGAELYLQCNNLDESIARIQEAGGRLLSERAPRDWGDTVAYYDDPDGNVIALAQRDTKEA